uniref:Uncharacterized protein n=1 Tax=Timema tahoe TaxID=61484 RepID=A0A7R9IGG6_9NEOP|nr:unnamed protein product [Timema tahoe]
MGVAFFLAPHRVPPPISQPDSVLEGGGVAKCVLELKLELESNASEDDTKVTERGPVSDKMSDTSATVNGNCPANTHVSFRKAYDHDDLHEDPNLWPDWSERATERARLKDRTGSISRYSPGTDPSLLVNNYRELSANHTLARTLASLATQSLAHSLARSSVWPNPNAQLSQYTRLPITGRSGFDPGSTDKSQVSDMRFHRRLFEIDDIHRFCSVSVSHTSTTSVSIKSLQYRATGVNHISR